MSSSTPAEPQRRGGALWHHPDFLKFWAGETVSLFGSQVTFLALPLTAVLVLSVSPEQLGLLRFLEYAPFLLFTLVFGVWVDRRRRRPVMVVANLARALLIGLVPVLSVAGVLHLSLLYLVAFAAGTFTVLFDLCWMSYVPSIVGRQHLIEANSKVATSYGAAEVAGPGLGGVLVQLLTAPRALAVDALSYVASMVSLLLIKAEEPPPAAPADGKRNLLREMGEGLRLVLRQPYLRATALQGGIWNFAFMASDPIFLLYAVRQLGFSPGLVGLIYGLGAIGGVLGSALASTVSRGRPLGAVLLGAVLSGTLPAFLLPLAAGPRGLMATLFVLAFFLVRGGLGVSNVLAITLRQTVTPNAMLGRMNSVMRTILYGVGTTGALVGGVLGSTLGLRPALWVAAVLYAVSLVPIILSPIPRLRTMPPPAEEPAAAEAPSAGAPVEAAG